jgi:hypothetical protein
VQPLLPFDDGLERPTFRAQIHLLKSLSAPNADTKKSEAARKISPHRLADHDTPEACVT